MVVRVFRPIRLRSSQQSNIFRSISVETEPHRVKLKYGGLLCLVIGCLLVLAIPVAVSAKAHFSVPVALGCLATLLLFAAMVMLALSKASKRWRNQFYEEIDSKIGSSGGSKRGSCKGKFSGGSTSEITPYKDPDDQESVLHNCKTTAMPIVTNGHSNSILPPAIYMDLQMIDEEGIATSPEGPTQLTFKERWERQKAQDQLHRGPKSDEIGKVDHSNSRFPEQTELESSNDQNDGVDRDHVILCHEIAEVDETNEDESNATLSEASAQATQKNNCDFETFASMHRGSVSSHSSKRSRSRRSSRTGLGSQESIGIPIDFNNRTPSGSPARFSPLETLYSVDDRKDGSLGVRIPSNQNLIDQLINSGINEDVDQDDHPINQDSGSKYRSFNPKSHSGSNSGEENDRNNNNGDDEDDDDDDDSNDDNKSRSTGDEFERFFEFANRISPHSSVRRSASSRQSRDKSPRTGLGSNESVGLTVKHSEDPKYRKFSMDNFLSIPASLLSPTSSTRRSRTPRKGSHPALHSKFINCTTAKIPSCSPARRASLNVVNKPKSRYYD